ncbi:MAG: hypothetical protein AB8B95_02750 [Pseudohongiellaceae bacterium]
MAIHFEEDQPQLERDAKLLPVVATIFLCYVCIVSGSYFIGNYLF